MAPANRFPRTSLLSLPLRVALLGSLGLLPACDSSADEGTAGAAAAMGTLDENVLRLDVSEENPRTHVAPPNAVNAYWMARMSELAYSDEATQRRALGLLGVAVTDTNYRFFDRGGMQAFYVATDRFAIVAFRGTEADDLDDWETNLNGGIFRPRGWVGRVHKGFDAGLRVLWEDAGMRAFLAERHNFDHQRDSGRSRAKPLFMTGHSLGGALATVGLLYSLVDGCLEAEKALLARGIEVEDTEDDPAGDPFLACRNKTIPVTGMFTFGSPRVTDSVLSAWLGELLLGNGVTMHRFVNQSDGVAQVPGFTGLMDYKHIGLKPQIGGDVDEDAFLAYFDSRGNMSIGSFTESRGVSVGDHRLARYVEGVRAFVHGQKRILPPTR